MYPLTSTSGELLGLMYAGECLIFALLLLPVYIAYLFYVPKEKFKQMKFRKLEGIIYDDEVKTSTDWEMAYFVFYLLRRIIYMATAYWISSQSLQLIVILYLNILVTVYLGQVKPKVGRFFNRLEVSNEFLFQLISFHQFLFTQFVPDVLQKFEFGWSWMSMVTLLVAFNLAIIFYVSFKNL
jgi:hypothetical protein